MPITELIKVNVSAKKTEIRKSLSLKGDDFAHYLKYVPGVYFFVRPAKQKQALKNAIVFDFNDNIIKLMSEFWLTLVL